MNVVVCVTALIVQKRQKRIKFQQSPEFKFPFWLPFLYHGTTCLLFNGRRVSLLKLNGFSIFNRSFRRKMLKSSTVVLFCRYWNSNFSTVLRYNSACACKIPSCSELVVLEEHKVRMKKLGLEFLSQNFNRKKLVLSSINQIYNPLIEDIAVKMRL